MAVDVFLLATDSATLHFVSQGERCDLLSSIARNVALALPAAFGNIDPMGSNALTVFVLPRNRRLKDRRKTQKNSGSIFAST